MNAAARVVAPAGGRASARRTINAAGLALVKEFEGLRLVAYDDLAPNRTLKKGDAVAGTLTIGHGHTGPDVHVGQRITAAQAEALLREDLGEAERAVGAALAREAGDNAFSAMVSLAFNIGGPRFARSSVCRRFNRGDLAGAAEAFSLWNKAGGRVLPGLVRRRAAEAALFLKPEARGKRPATESPDGVTPTLSTLAKVQAAVAGATATVAPAVGFWQELESTAAALPGWGKGLAVAAIAGVALWLLLRPGRSARAGTSARGA